MLDQLKTNLVHYNNWSQVTDHAGLFVSGLPPAKLDARDEDNRREWVVPRSNQQPQLSVREIDQWFVKVAEESGTRPERIAVGILNDDGTVVYYFIHDGVVVPPQN